MYFSPRYSVQLVENEWDKRQGTLVEAAEAWTGNEMQTRDRAVSESTWRSLVFYPHLVLDD